MSSAWNCIISCLSPPLKHRTHLIITFTNTSSLLQKPHHFYKNTERTSSSLLQKPPEIMRPRLGPAYVIACQHMSRVSTCHSVSAHVIACQHMSGVSAYSKWRVSISTVMFSGRFPLQHWRGKWPVNCAQIVYTACDIKSRTSILFIAHNFVLKFRAVFLISVFVPMRLIWIPHICTQIVY